MGSFFINKNLWYPAPMAYGPGLLILCIISIIRKDRLEMLNNTEGITDMEIRAFDPEKDFESIKNWASDERTHSMWCANRFRFPLEKENLKEALSAVHEQCGDLAYVAVVEGTVRGFFCYSYNADSREAMLKFVIVDPSYRGKGLAAEMFDRILRHAFNETEAIAVHLMVFPQNPRAKRFYEKIGFKERRTDVGVFTYKDESWDRCNMVIAKADF